jgi:hypothetical protein
MRKMRGDLGAQTHTRARSTYGKVASAAGLNVFEHCKRLERDLPSSSRCLANFQRVLKAIDKQVYHSRSEPDRCHIVYCDSLRDQCRNPDCLHGLSVFRRTASWWRHLIESRRCWS